MCSVLFLCFFVFCSFLGGCQKNGKASHHTSSARAPPNRLPDFTRAADGPHKKNGATCARRKSKIPALEVF